VFALTSGLGVEKKERQFLADHDDRPPPTIEGLDGTEARRSVGDDDVSSRASSVARCLQSRAARPAASSSAA
jgi:hypothetical protein